MALCASRAAWEDTRKILALVDTASLTVESATGMTLWTRGSANWPVPQDSDFPLRLLVHRAQNSIASPRCTACGSHGLGWP